MKKAVWKICSNLTREIIWEGDLADFLKTQEQGITHFSAYRSGNSIDRICGNCSKYSMSGCSDIGRNVRYESSCEYWEGK